MGTYFFILVETGKNRITHQGQGHKWPCLFTIYCGVILMVKMSDFCYQAQQHLSPEKLLLHYEVISTMSDEFKLLLYCCHIQSKLLEIIM